jgi:hypothetical protein
MHFDRCRGGGKHPHGGLYVLEVESLLFEMLDLTEEKLVVDNGVAVVLERSSLVEVALLPVVHGS